MLSLPKYLKSAGCMADRKTYQEAVTNAEIIIQEWIKTAQANGRSILIPKNRLMSIEK
jgi:predicted RNase H-like HicB family nuclease